MAPGPPGSILPEGVTLSDVGHGLLDMAGFAPLIGEPADFANAAWLAHEGNYLDAGLSLISMVPIVGDVIGKGGKIVKAAGGKLTGKALEAVKKMDFETVLGRFRSNPKLAPHVDKIVDALENWRKELTGGLPDTPPGGCVGCKDKAMVPFDGEFATKQLLGTTTTPNGRQIQFHAADRMVNPPAGRARMSPTEVDDVLDGATKIVKRSYHPQGDTLTLENASIPGRPRVIVDAATGKKIITVINPRRR